MLESVKLKKEHIEKISRFSRIPVKMSEEKMSELENTPHCYAIVDGDDVLACVGGTKYWDQRFEVWTVLKKGVLPRIAEIKAELIRLLDDNNVKRIEAVMDCDLTIGRRWIESLGFCFRS